MSVIVGVMTANINEGFMFVYSDTISGARLSKQFLMLHISDTQAQRIHLQVHLDDLPFNLGRLKSHIEVLIFVKCETPLLDPIPVLTSLIGHFLGNFTMSSINYLT